MEPTGEGLARWGISSFDLEAFDFALENPELEVTVDGENQDGQVEEVVDPAEKNAKVNENAS